MSSPAPLEPGDRPMPVVPAASDPHGPVIVKYTVLASYLVTFIIGLGDRRNRNRSSNNYFVNGKRK